MMCLAGIKSTVGAIINSMPWYRQYKIELEMQKEIDKTTIRKSEVIKKYQKKYGTDIFVETGTYLGNMLWLLGDSFETLCSIELDPFLFARVHEKYKRFSNVILLNGNSETELKIVLSHLNKPALFWLDAHYSGGITAKGTIDTPVRHELKMILNHKIKDHIILIDDAHLFTPLNKDYNGYPVFEEMKRCIERSFKKIMHIEDDIIVIEPDHVS